MPFTPFSDFQAVINSNFRLFPLTSLSKNFFDTLHLGFEVYKNSKYKQTGLNKKQMGFREFIDGVFGFYRRQNDVGFLTKSESWEKFSEQTQDNIILQKQLAETQENFKAHERFATHSNSALWDAYNKLLTLERLFNLALSELKIARYRLKDLAEKYEIYLTQQLALLKTEQEDILANMLNRLFLCAQDPTLENTDALPEIIKDLKSKGFLKDSYTAPSISNDKLTKAMFYQFHEAVLNSHHPQAMNIIQALPWFKKHSNLSDRFHVTELMPNKARKPDFLFFNANLRFNWFNNFYTQAKIDASLQYLHTQKVRGELSFQSLAYRVLVIASAEKAIELELERIKTARVNCQEGLRKYFNQTTLLFLNKIEANIYAQKLLLITEKIILMEFLSITPEEHLENIDLARFMLELKKDLDNIKNHELLQRFNASSKNLKKILTKRHEKQLKDYLYQWIELPHKPLIDQGLLNKLHKTAHDQEELLKFVLSEEWAAKISQMQNMRLQHKFSRLEKIAQENMIQILGVKPIILKESIQKELDEFKKSLLNYIKTQIYDFDYEDQKQALSRIICLLIQEDILEAENSNTLSASQKDFLREFPQVNFYINSVLQLTKTSEILDKLYNPVDIEEHLNSIYRFIKRQEAKFLAKNPAKFIDLIPKTKAVEENRELINQLKKGML